ncbi:MAG TPA: hypothetical protein VF131_18325 [Blastocatellia bacterium]|nr:hypothetical protein [Blastocatellia bacterium]
MKRALTLALCLSTYACSSGVTFNRVQPLGQKSVYKMQNNVKSEVMSLVIDRGTRSSEINMSAVLMTDVIDSQPNGNWTLANTISQVETKVNGENKPDVGGLLVDKPFSIIYDQEGKVVKVTGTESIGQGMNIEKIFSQLSPTAMLPNKQVKVGESWPFEITSREQGASTQTLKGVGTLLALNGDDAVMEFDFIVQISVEGDESMNLSGNGKGKTTAVYDTDKARFISNKSDVTIETTGKVTMGEKSEPIKNTLTTSMQIDLVNK